VTMLNHKTPAPIRMSLLPAEFRPGDVLVERDMARPLAYVRRKVHTVTIITGKDYVAVEVDSDTVTNGTTTKNYPRDRFVTVERGV